MKDVESLWKEALPYIKKEISSTGYATVFETITPSHIDDNTLYLSTTNAIYMDIFDIYKDKVKNALFEVLSYPMDVEIFVGSEMKKEKPPVIKTQSQPVFDNDSRLNSNFTFENFIKGKNSEFAYTAAYAISQGIDKYNPLFLYGGSGLGKTHLLYAVGNEIKRRDPSKNVLYITGEEFVNSFVAAIKNETNIEFRNKYRNIDVLLLDDIQFFAGKEGTQEEFFHTFNELIRANKQLMFTSDRPPKDIIPLEERIRTRLESGLMTDIQPPDFETRLAILHAKVGDDFEGQIPDEIFNIVAQTIKSNIRTLEGAMSSIIGWSEVQKKNIDIETANQILERYFTESYKRKIDAELIIKEVQKYFGLGDNTIKSNKRNKEYAYPRQVAMTIVRELTNLSFSEIGKEFNRNHSTVIHNIDKMKEEMEKDIKTMNLIQDLIKNIKDYEE